MFQGDLDPMLGSAQSPRSNQSATPNLTQAKHQQYTTKSTPDTAKNMPKSTSKHTQYMPTTNIHQQIESPPHKQIKSGILKTRSKSVDLLMEDGSGQRSRDRLRKKTKDAIPRGLIGTSRGQTPTRTRAVTPSSDRSTPTRSTPHGAKSAAQLVVKTVETRRADRKGQPSHDHVNGKPIAKIQGLSNGQIGASLSTEISQAGDCSQGRSLNIRDHTPGRSGNSRDQTPGRSGNSRDQTPGRSVNSQDRTPGRSGNSRDQTPGRSQNSRDRTPGRSGNSRDQTPGRSQNSRDRTPGRSGNSRDRTPGRFRATPEKSVASKTVEMRDCSSNIHGSTKPPVLARTGPGKRPGLLRSSSSSDILEKPDKTPTKRPETLPKPHDSNRSPWLPGSQPITVAVREPRRPADRAMHRRSQSMPRLMTRINSDDGDKAHLKVTVSKDVNNITTRAARNQAATSAKLKNTEHLSSRPQLTVHPRPVPAPKPKILQKSKSGSQVAPSKASVAPSMTSVTPSKASATSKVNVTLSRASGTARYRELAADVEAEKLSLVMPERYIYNSVLKKDNIDYRHVLKKPVSDAVTDSDLAIYKDIDNHLLIEPTFDPLLKVSDPLKNTSDPIPDMSDSMLNASDSDDELNMGFEATTIDMGLDDCSSGDGGMPFDLSSDAGPTWLKRALNPGQSQRHSRWDQFQRRVKLPGDKSGRCGGRHVRERMSRSHSAGELITWAQISEGRSQKRRSREEGEAPSTREPLTNGGLSLHAVPLHVRAGNEVV